MCIFQSNSRMTEIILTKFGIQITYNLEKTHCEVRHPSNSVNRDGKELHTKIIEKND